MVLELQGQSMQRRGTEKVDGITVLRLIKNDEFMLRVGCWLTLNRTITMNGGGGDGDRLLHDDEKGGTGDSGVDIYKK